MHMGNFRNRIVAALGFAVVALALAGCNSDEDPVATPTSAKSPTATASASPTATPEPTSTPDYGAPDPCPVDQAICDFAVEIQELIAAADFAGLESLTRPGEFTCPVSEYSADFCEGAAPGEVREGFRIRRLGSHGTIESSILPTLRSSIIQDADDWLGYYKAPYPVGIHCPVGEGAIDCRDQFIVYFSLLGPNTNFNVARTSGGLAIFGLQLGNTLEDHDRIDFYEGDLRFVADDGVVDGWFYRWRGRTEPDPRHEVPRRWLLAPPEVTGVTVSPASGPCPATLMLSLAEEPDREAGKEPLPSVWIVAGVSGIEVGIPGRPPLVEQNPPWLADGRSFEVQLEADMLEGTLCDGDTVSMLAWGGDGGPVLVGYAIER